MLDSLDVCETTRHGHRGVSPTILFEVPHGATTVGEYDLVRAALESDLPSDLDAFFHVNTDVGAPEVARATAEILARAHDLSSLVVRGLVPRTFVDLNRTLDVASDELTQIGLTPPIPPYLDHPRDRSSLAALHRRYLDAVEEAYASVCSAGGLAVALHTYAPRSIGLGTVDRQVVEKLREAYLPEAYERWPRRPEVDLITRDGDGRLLAPPALLELVRTAYVEAGFEVAESATYRLYEATMGHRHATRWPGRVLCLELRRDLLVREFDPFGPKEVLTASVARAADPLATALGRALRAPSP